jgi:uncharacterized metal-binding protein YceD (DUF177 family)
MIKPPFSETVRLNQIGSGIDRRVEPDPAARERIRRALDLARLNSLAADVRLEPAGQGWRLTGRVRADLEQTCGLTLEPLPVTVDETFNVSMVEASEHQPAEEDVEITLDDDSPDVIEDGVIDLGVYVVEQLALNLDPFPRKPGATFVQPEEPEEISPFAVLRRIGPKAGDEEG